MEYSKIPSAVTERPSSPEEGYRRKKEERTSFQFYKWVLSMLFSSLWLFPAVLILIINFRGQFNPRAGIVGQSIGCVGKSNRCKLNLQSVSQISRSEELAKLDKNALGALQLAAKALEVWFVTIAASLIFIMIRVIARLTLKSSLPLHFLYVHTTLGELLSLGQLLIWKPIATSLKSLSRRIWKRSSVKRLETWNSDLGRTSSWWRPGRLFIFSMFTIFVSVICSLMGPSTAVLLLPAMQWTIINSDTTSPSTWLNNIKASQPPLNIPVKSCTGDKFTVGNFSCLSGYYSAFVDSLAAGAVATDTHAFMGGGGASGLMNTLVVLPMFQEGNVTFSANISGANPVIWVPLRQIIRDFNQDVENYDLATTSTSSHPQSGYPDSDLFQKSLQARLQRDGPTVGMQSNCHLNGPNEQTIDSFMIGTNKTVHCYKSPTITKCIPSGNGWFDIDQSSSSFVVLNVESANVTGKDVNVTVYSASTSLTMPSSEFGCIKNNTCGWDWSTAFSRQVSFPNVTITAPLQVTEYTSPNVDPLSGIWCASTFVISSAQYVLDPSLVSNVFRRVELNVNGNNGTIDTGKPLYVNSDWILTGWAVNRNGSVNGLRNVAIRHIFAWQNWVRYGDSVQAFPDFNNIQRFLAIQSLSFLPFNTTLIQPASKIDADQKISSYAQIQAWKYDLSSRTSKMGAVIMIVGSLLVILRTALYWHYKSDLLDATEILESVLHRYRLIRIEGVPEGAGDYPLIVTDDNTGETGFRG